MNELYLIPNDGVTVRDPLTGQPLPPTGASKPCIGYWLRRLRDGDVTEGAPPKAVPTKATTPSTTASKGDAT